MNITLRIDLSQYSILQLEDLLERKLITQAEFNAELTERTTL